MKPTASSRGSNDAAAPATASQTAATLAGGIRTHAPETDTVFVCGGGAFNTTLLRRLQALLPQLRVGCSDEYGLPAMHVEGAAFAWLAMRLVHELPGNLPAVTGARGPRLLGSYTPA